jgi:hypothetical protein
VGAEVSSVLRCWRFRHCAVRGSESLTGPLSSGTVGTGKQEAQRLIAGISLSGQEDDDLTGCLTADPGALGPSPRGCRGRWAMMTGLEDCVACAHPVLVVRCNHRQVRTKG